ncbi:MAG: hypothetical protein M5U21_07315 [Fimbriimonadaceae bacterium]|nr:hypothetical protein [Fimbriimonadaceae bacterium]
MVCGRLPIVGGGVQIVGGSIPIVSGGVPIVDEGLQIAGGGVQIVGGGVQIVGGRVSVACLGPKLGGAPGDWGDAGALQGLGVALTGLGGQPAMGSRASPFALGFRPVGRLGTYVEVVSSPRCPTHGQWARRAQPRGGLRCERAGLDALRETIFAQLRNLWLRSSKPVV